MLPEAIGAQESWSHRGWGRELRGEETVVGCNNFRKFLITRPRTEWGRGSFIIPVLLEAGVVMTSKTRAFTRGKSRAFLGT